MLFLQVIGVALMVAAVSLIGVFLFGHDRRLIGLERYVVPVAVGVFLSLVLNELIPETIAASEHLGPAIILVGFLAFYVLSQRLHEQYHHLAEEDCDRKGAAMLLLTGDAVHNFADGVILGAAFLADPAVGVATAIGLALHEAPQEIVEFGVLLRAGFTRTKAALLNFISASTIVLGAAVVFMFSAHLAEYIWVVVGFAAGNLLYLAASDLLPRIHGNLEHYGAIWKSIASIVLGFALMTGVLDWAHSNMHEAGHDHELHEVIEY